LTYTSGLVLFLVTKSTNLSDGFFREILPSVFSLISKLRLFFVGVPLRLRSAWAYLRWILSTSHRI